jgi:holo-[acyl-carrier protein] synthase
MIVAIGIDLVSVERVHGVLARHGERASRRLFTAAELAECAGRADADRCLAARFAAKEAALKALGTGKQPGVRWTDLEVARDAAGRPALRVYGGARERAGRLGATRIWVSLTCAGGVAGALVVIESEPAWRLERR